MFVIDRKIVGCVVFFSPTFSTLWSVEQQNFDHSVVQDVIVQNQEMLTTCGGHCQGPMSPAVMESYGINGR